MIFSKEKINTYLLALFCSACILLFFLVANHEIYLPIGKNLSDYSSDGIKNLYTFAYYLKYDSGLQFSGLFYPFTEHVIYMDAQPLWVWSIQFIEKVFHFHIENPIVYIHLILLLNLFWASFFVFLILHKYSSSFILSCVGTCVIILLSPQIFRFSSHYALGNMAVIPLFWYVYMHLNAKTGVFKYGLFSIGLIGVGYIHPYLLLMLVFLFLSYEFVSFFILKKIQWKSLLSSVLSIILFQFSIQLVDSISDRPVSAWGAKEFSCRIYDLLLPMDGFVKNLFPDLPKNYTEGHGYVSIFGIVVLFILVVKGLSHLFQKKKYFSIQYGSIEHWVLASLPVLLFAFFIPFRWSFMDWTMDLIPMLKQFRGTGRFVVVFYYVFIVYAFVYLHRLYRKHPKIISVLFVICTLMSFYDIYNNTNRVINDYRQYGFPDAYNVSKKRAEEMFAKVENIEDYQCIIPYPPSTEGTEVMWLDADWYAKTQYFWYSYFYHLPLATVHSSRASFSNNMKIVQLSGFYSSPKPVLNKFDPNKPCFVLAEDKHQYENIPLIKNAKWIQTIQNLALYSIESKDLKGDALNERIADWVDTSAFSRIGENSFDNQKQGHLSLKNPKEHIEVFRTQLPQDYKDKTLRILFWYTPKLYPESDIPIMEIYKVKDGKEIFIHDWREMHTQTFNYRAGWFCVDYSQAVDNETQEIVLKMYSRNIFADDLLVFLKK